MCMESVLCDYMAVFLIHWKDLSGVLLKVAIYIEITEDSIASARSSKNLRQPKCCDVIQKSARASLTICVSAVLTLPVQPAKVRTMLFFFSNSRLFGRERIFILVLAGRYDGDCIFLRKRSDNASNISFSSALCYELYFKLCLQLLPTELTQKLLVPFCCTVPTSQWWQVH